MGKCCHLQMELLRRKKKPNAFLTPKCQMLELWKRIAASELSCPVYPAHALPRETKVQL